MPDLRDDDQVQTIDVHLHGTGVFPMNSSRGEGPPWLVSLLKGLKIQTFGKSTEEFVTHPFSQVQVVFFNISCGCQA